jgi:hypothetical protein
MDLIYPVKYSLLVLAGKRGLGGGEIAGNCTDYTVKKVNDFPVPSRDVTYQTLPGGNNLIIPGQREFG